MLHRIKQFRSALTAQLTPKDWQFIHHYLTPAERQLFYAMDLPTQYHCYRVAQTCCQLTHHTAHGLDQTLLIKAALLHDLGKPHRSLTTRYRVMIVLANYLSPQIGCWLAKPVQQGWLGKLQYAFYIQKHHADLGAAQALQHGLSDQLAQLIRLHHQGYTPTDSPELILLRRADNQN